MAHEILVPPISSPLSLDEVRLYLRFGSNEDDGILVMFIKAAIEKVENKYHKAFASRTVRETFSGAEILNAFNLSMKVGRNAFLRPHFTPITNILSVKILDQFGSSRTAPNDLIILEDHKFTIKNWEYSLQIDYETGGAANSEIPAEYKHIIFEEIAAAIARRDNEAIKTPISEINRGAQL